MIIGTLAMIYIFILAIFTGVEVISRVPTVLHTPLMSGANAIHGIVLIGGVILLGTAGDNDVLFALGFIAVILGTLNVVGGFVVTDRMLEMFKAKTPDKTGQVEMNHSDFMFSVVIDGQLIPAIAYLIASLMFIIGLKRLSNPRTARSGNLIAGIGMGLALLGTFLLPNMGHFCAILIAIVIGTIPGWLLAKRVKMTAMPQMVSLFNGMGGACALFISLGEWRRGAEIGPVFPTLLGIVLGSLSFTGSLVAFGKLQGIISEKAFRWPLQKTINALLLLTILVSACASAANPEHALLWILVLAAAALLLGVLQVLPIGGADMPVVISVLNSCTGLAAAVTGFAMHNMAMIIAGTLVGAAGSLLTLLMCKAMNRSLAKVVFGSFGMGVQGAAAAASGDQTMREIAAAECAIMMGYARKVIIIPGYGLAVAQGQHLVHELDEMLGKRGVEVKYAIHPVAGRMPGHMNVLLAEADVPYPKLLDMEEINPEFEQTDVALIIGANDVVNPAARTDPASPIYGMPILNADKARNIIVIKRGRGAGFAGIENGLFYNPKTRMLFGDAKNALQELITEVRGL